MAPSIESTQPTYPPERGYTIQSTSIHCLRTYDFDTSIDYEIYYTPRDNKKEAEQVKYYFRLGNKLNSLDTLKALSRKKSKIQDICVRQFVSRIIRQPKPKSNLRAKLYK